MIFGCGLVFLEPLQMFLASDELLHFYVLL